MKHEINPLHANKDAADWIDRLVARWEKMRHDGTFNQVMELNDADLIAWVDVFRAQGEHR